MAQVLVRNLEDAVVEQLKSTAARHHRSLEAEVRSILEDAARRAAATDEFLARADRIRAELLQAHGGRPFSDSSELIREDRER